MDAGNGLTGASSPLGDRYTVVKELGRGGFGQTYLASDQQRHGELCVIKEFVPQIADTAMLAQAQALFEQEAHVLYRLNHKQIPAFHQLLKVESETGGRLFFVQEYIAGVSYQSLLEERQRFGGQFTETEITHLLYALLPVLAYIHSMGLVHRDISPDNLILRQSDGLPVLIDFGSVKEIAAAVRGQLDVEGERLGPTRIGKVGYVPPEQMNTDQPNAASDLYGLAATLLVLATGKDPQVLHDPYHVTWHGYERLSPKLGQILRKMLSANPEERFPNAESVLVALAPEDSASLADPDGEAMPMVNSDALYATEKIEDTPVNLPSAADHGPKDNAAEAANLAATFAIASPGSVDSSAAGGDLVDGNLVDGNLVEGDLVEGDLVEGNFADGDFADGGFAETTLVAGPNAAFADDGAEAVPPASHSIGQPGAREVILAALAAFSLVGTLLLWVLPRFTNSSPDAGRVVREVQTPIADGELTDEEIVRRQAIVNRQTSLGIGDRYFTNLVNQLFYEENPELLASGPNGTRQELTDAAKDEPLRSRWQKIALETLTILENHLTAQSLTALGSYSDDNRERWRSQVSAVNVSERALDDLVDTKFFRLFPSQSGRDFFNQPIAQIYYAIADDTARAIESGRAREDIRFAEGSFSEDVSAQLAPGAGRIYTVRLSAGQQLRLNLTAPAESTLLSLYLPNPDDDNPYVFADSEQTIWSGALTQSGYYEIVVVNRSTEPATHQLTLSVDSVTSTPATPESAATEEEEEEAPAETETPTDSNPDASDDTATDASGT
ncbi:MAG: serine/threonine protein kinase [Phormidesmis sp. RL_2_1]|nr:serine/threonine protein kinase [Phormidesmis sp. RL_2_1]